MTNTSQPLAPAAVVLHTGVADFDSWLAAFDAHEDARRAAGILGHHINRAEGDPNEFSVFMGLSDLNRAKEFATSDELRERMKASGVVGAPEITYMTPVREAVVWDRQLPAIILSHSVADFDRWLEGYDGAADLQRENGIIGQAANRSLDDPSVAIVYHQAESFDTLRAFLGKTSSRPRCRQRASRQRPTSTSSPEDGARSTPEPAVSTAVPRAQRASREVLVTDLNVPLRRLTPAPAINRSSTRQIPTPFRSASDATSNYTS